MTISPSSHCSDGDHGTIRYVDPSGEPDTVNFYWTSELLQFGDQVEFRLATRTYDGLVYAVDIHVTQRAKDIRFRVRGQGGTQSQYVPGSHRGVSQRCLQGPHRGACRDLTGV